MTELEKVIGYEYKNPSYLEEALTHSSYVNGRNNSNERLEFLGDSVLSVVVSKYLFNAVNETFIVLILHSNLNHLYLSVYQVVRNHNA